MKQWIVFLLIFSVITCTPEESDQPPVPCFTWTPDTISVGTKVYFDNCSSGAKEFFWDFGDGDDSEDPQPVKVFDREGYFPVRLDALNDHGERSLTKTIQVGSPCETFLSSYDPSCGIDYSKPELYLIPGEQSELSSVHLEEIRSQIGTPGLDIPGIRLVVQWFHNVFTTSATGGSMVGKVSVDELYEVKKTYGCHSEALVLTSVLRGFGFPTVMTETADVNWAYEYREGNIQYFSGHVMTEVYVNNSWILLDNNGYFIEGYDPTDPFISVRDPNSLGLYSYAKGRDYWEYGDHDGSFTGEAMIHFVSVLQCLEDRFGSNQYVWQR